MDNADCKKGFFIESRQRAQRPTADFQGSVILNLIFISLMGRKAWKDLKMVTFYSPNRLLAMTMRDYFMTFGAFFAGFKEGVCAGAPTF